MAEQKDKKTKHLRSARQWLTRAEESFDKDCEVRGELNLFLAQAELQHAQETGQSRGLLKKYPVIRHCLAVMVAITLASTAYGVYNQSSGNMVERPMPEANAAQPLTPAAKEQNMVSLQPPAVAPLPVPAVVVRQAEAPAAQQVSRPAVSKHVEPAVVQINEQPSPVSAEEMKVLIRAAGKSLRSE